MSRMPRDHDPEDVAVDHPEVADIPTQWPLATRQPIATRPLARILIRCRASIGEDATSLVDRLPINAAWT